MLLAVLLSGYTLSIQRLGNAPIPVGLSAKFAHACDDSLLRGVWFKVSLAALVWDFAEPIGNTSVFTPVRLEVEECQFSSLARQFALELVHAGKDGIDKFFDCALSLYPAPLRIVEFDAPAGEVLCALNRLNRISEKAISAPDDDGLNLPRPQRPF
jgi:hypothetical protein